MSYMFSRSPSSREYGKRKNAGDVVCQFGASETTRWRSRSSAVKIRDLGGMSEMTQPFKYMFQKLMDKAFGESWLQCAIKDILLCLLLVII